MGSSRLSIFLFLPLALGRARSGCWLLAGRPDALAFAAIRVVVAARDLLAMVLASYHAGTVVEAHRAVFDLEDRVGGFGVAS